MTRPDEYPRMEGPETYDAFNADEAKQDRTRRFVELIIGAALLGLAIALGLLVLIAGAR